MARDGVLFPLSFFSEYVTYPIALLPYSNIQLCHTKFLKFVHPLGMQGRPKGVTEKFRLTPLVARLSELLGAPVSSVSVTTTSVTTKDPPPHLFVGVLPSEM